MSNLARINNELIACYILLEVMQIDLTYNDTLPVKKEFASYLKVRNDVMGTKTKEGAFEQIIKKFPDHFTDGIYSLTYYFDDIKFIKEYLIRGFRSSEYVPSFADEIYNKKCSKLLGRFFMDYLYDNSMLNNILIIDAVILNRSEKKSSEKHHMATHEYAKLTAKEVKIAILETKDEVVEKRIEIILEKVEDIGKKYEQVSSDIVSERYKTQYAVLVRKVHELPTFEKYIWHKKEIELLAKGLIEGPFLLQKNNINSEE